MKEPHDYWLDEREKAIKEATLCQAFEDAETVADKLLDSINGYLEYDVNCSELEEAHILVKKFIDRRIRIDEEEE